MHKYKWFHPMFREETIALAEKFKIEMTYGCLQ
jgi:hypothetical protein